MPRRQISGVPAIAAALGREPLRLILARKETEDPALSELCERAASLGVRVLPCTDAELWRLATRSDPLPEALALLGPDPAADLAEVLRWRGALWLACGLEYPGNTGFVIRTAEVSGADAVVIDNDFDAGARKKALRAAMGADRFLPVLWESAGDVADAAKEAGYRLVGVEDTGDRAPWETDLAGAVAVVIGGEHDGVPAAVLERCDEVVRVPMAGFIPSYNVQAAMSAVAAERLRQLSSGSD